MKNKIIVLFAGVLLLAQSAGAFAADTKKPDGWPEGKFFGMGKVNGRAIFMDPKGKPFYSRAMVYAYGPEQGPLKGKVTAEIVLQELELMKKNGFNTLDLYGNAYLQEILKWCDENEFAVYFRTSYTNKEFPDFMDNSFRDEAKHFYDNFLADIKGHPCVLAVDMDQRWLFELDWSGKKRLGRPKLGPEAIKFMPAWLEGKYKKIEDLNRLWGKKYASFADVIKDRAIISGGAVNELDRKPWRVDIVEYTLWTMNDFLKDLTAYIKIIDPDHMITYTTELPEVAPFQISTKENSGIDFISPVHYNLDSDYGRDWIANAKLIFQTKFHSDLSGLPVFINESGFRTTWLGAAPENMGYASARLNDERHVAELYLRQASVTASYPWMLGWGWFMWYDKWLEGDFGYIRDDRSLKPVSDVGQYITGNIAVNLNKEKSPKAWIYYPEYSLASPLASFRQDKTLMMLLENDFLADYEKMVQEVMPNIAKPDENIAKTRIINDLPDIFNQKWLPFAFTASIPDDSNVILLSGGALEQLSMADRIVLAGKKTITFGPIGLTDERYNETTPWYLDIVGLSKDNFAEKALCLKLDKFFNNNGISAKGRKGGDLDGEGNAYYAEELPDGNKVFECKGMDAVFTFPDKTGRSLNNIKCDGQAIVVPEGAYTKAHFLLASSNGDICAKVAFFYSDGSSDEVYFAPTISDWRSKPYFGHAAIETTGKRYMAHLAVPVSPSKNLVSIKLPAAPSVHIFAITLAQGGTAKNVEIEVQKGSITSSGLCYWALSVPKAKDAPYNVLATFKNGDSAIVQSKDGKHIAYLYDPLTWGNNEKEISADTKNQADILKSLMAK